MKLSKILLILISCLLCRVGFAEEGMTLSTTLKGFGILQLPASFSPDGKYLVSGGEDDTIKLWSVSEGKLLQTLKGYSGLVSFSPDGRYLATVGRDDTIKLWSVPDGRLLQTLKNYYYVSRIALSFSPDSRFLASGGNDADNNSIIKLWSVSDGRLLQTLLSFPPDISKYRGKPLINTIFVSAISFSSDGRYLAARGSDGTIKLWSVPDGRVLQSFGGHTEGVFSVSFSPDGRYLVSEGSDFTIKLWSVPDGRLLQTFEGHDLIDGMFPVSFSPDGRYLISEGSDFTIKLWSVPDGRLLQTLTFTFKEFGKWVPLMSFSSDGRLLALVYEGGLWSVMEKKVSVSAEDDIAINIPQGTPNADAIGVIISVQDYENKDVPPVDYAINDGEMMKDYFMKVFGIKEENIIFVKNAKKSDFERIFGIKDDCKGQLYNFIKPNISDVYIYYVGHGVPDVTTKNAYFLPSDANPNFVRLNGYSMDLLNNNLSKLPAKSTTLIVDACFSGISQKGMLIKNASGMAIVPKIAIVPKTEIKGRIFTASSGEQIASWYPDKRHSLFTYFFLKGLKGEADKNKDKKITIGEISDYVKEQVSPLARRLYNREQTPEISGDVNQILVSFR
ncbi:MAG: caspase family protein [Candidatus Desantisbacteria bacterium]